MSAPSAPPIRLTPEERLKARNAESREIWQMIQRDIKANGGSAARHVLGIVYTISDIHVQKREALEDRIAALEAVVKPRVRVKAIHRPSA